MIVDLQKSPEIRVLTPPANIAELGNQIRTKSVFLAGSIDNGVAPNWQKELIELLKEPTRSFGRIELYRNLTVFNPRRSDWNPAWKAELSNPEFYRQVAWELNALKVANYIIMNFLPGSKSPISLLELGLYASSGKMCVICPEGFHAKGNVDFICEAYNIPMIKDLQEAVNYIDRRP